ncbi:MAG: hypothetical protein AAF596_00850 [Planctomycetota bacterium]
MTANAGAAETASASKGAGNAVDLFDAIDEGQVEVTFIAKSSSRGRVIIENKSGQAVNLRLPEAFAGVPALAQFGGGNQGGGGFGGGGGGGGQGTGGGFGGGGAGGGGGGLGGGGGAFSVAADKVARVDVGLLCLEHGKKDPTSSKPYKMVPVTDFVKRPAVIELLKAFGRGELHHGAAQAAAWNLNNDLSWQQLQAKLAGTARDFNRSPYFSRNELQAAFAYANEAHRLAALNADSYRSLADRGSSLSDRSGKSLDEDSLYEEPTYADSRYDESGDGDESGDEEASGQEAAADDREDAESEPSAGAVDHETVEASL